MKPPQSQAVFRIYHQIHYFNLHSKLSNSNGNELIQDQKKNENSTY